MFHNNNTQRKPRVSDGIDVVCEQPKLRSLQPNVPNKSTSEDPPGQQYGGGWADGFMS